MTSQVAQDLRAAAEVLRRDGWCQGSIHDGLTGARCAWGGICQALIEREARDFDSDRFDIALVITGEALRAVIPDVVAMWNDEPGRTADEVIAALLAAADAAEDSDD